jgi:hypothetical protein
MTRPKSLLLASILALVAACKPSNTGGLDLHGEPKAGKKDPPAPSSSSSADASKPEASDAHRLAWQAIGCFIGGPWSEALGASGEERILADTKRCREVATGPLGAKPEDGAALDAVRNLEPAVVERVIAGLAAIYGNQQDQKLLQLVKATADAAREAHAVRRITVELRKTKSKSPSDADVAALSSKDALAALGKLGTEEGKLVQLVLGADRLESARGLDARGKLLAASPGLDVIFGVPSSKSGAETKQADWVAYLSSAAKAAGHPPKTAPDASLAEQEQAAFTAVAQGFADRFEALAAKLAPGVAKGVANGYAAQLRSDLAGAETKVKSNASAKKKPGG